MTTTNTTVAEMKMPEPFYIDSSKSKMYYNNTDLFQYNKLFFYGCTTKPKTIITKKSIPETEYLYANLKKNEWNLSSAECKKSQLLISKDWVDTYYFKMSERKVVEKPITIVTELVKEESFIEIPEQEPKQIVEESTMPVKENEEIVEAPRLLILNENEKFKDADGNIIEIETRGERLEDKIYFKCKDVSVGFGITDLNTVLLNKQSGYVINVDYVNFKREIRLINYEPKTTNKNYKTTLYLTYEGLLRVLFVSRNKNASIFRKWATHKLFTIQMGKEEEKVKLGTSILNIPEKTYKAVFQKHANKFPCIYLLSLGKVGELRETFEIVDTKIPDDSVVYKYGFTDDLGRRIGEHETNYGKLKNVKIVLSTFHIVDPKYTCDAEGDIREECNAYEIGLQTERHKELIVLNKKQLEHVTKNYGRIGRDYAGHTAELQVEISKLKEEIKELNHEISRLKTHIETNDRYHKLELQNKDLNISNLELQIKLFNNNNNK
jgi:hypothetical protein